MDKSQLIELLQKSEGPVSGEALSKVLGISRAAVWKGIEGLRREGYEIASATRRGYTLLSMPKGLDAEAIRTPFGIGSNICCLSSIDSTNTECKRRSMEGASGGLVIISEEQTAGRGRVSKSFSSPKGLGLYYSVLLRPDWAPMDAINLTACIAVSVCDAIEKTAGVRPMIKWTNDLILGGKKVCGILTEMEMETESGRIRHIIPGIGINCNQTQKDFPLEIQDIATSLFLETGKRVNRNALAKALSEELNLLYDTYLTSSKDYLQKYRRDCCTLGKEVVILSADGSKEEAFALDIDDDFSLVVRLSNGSLRKVQAGEVSVRGLCGYV